MTGKKFLAVGINHFLTPGNDLSGCVPDAHAMRGVAALLGIDADILTDANATRVNAMRWLNDAVAQAVSGKLSYLGFSWSGHGTHYNRPEEEDGLGEALVCYDIAQIGDDWNPGTIIKDAELRDLLNQVPSTCTVEVWLDTCYSGGMDRAFGLDHDRFLHNPGNTDRMLRLSNSSVGQGLNSNIIMWCASSEAQTSADTYISGGAHGAFTWFWVQAYNRKQEASRVELLLATRRGLAAGQYNQFPRLKCWNKAAQAVVGI